MIGSASATVSFTNTNLFQYVHIFVRTVSGTQTSKTSVAGYGYQIQVAGGSYSGLTTNTDFNISTSASNGAPIITYTNATTVSLMYNEVIY